MGKKGVRNNMYTSTQPKITECKIVFGKECSHYRLSYRPGRPLGGKMPHDGVGLFPSDEPIMFFLGAEKPQEAVIGFVPAGWLSI